MSIGELLSTIASEEASLASILSAEAVKADATARWVTLISDSDISQQTPGQIIEHVVNIQKSVSSVISSTADKEVAIAAKTCALLGKKCAPITWQVIRCAKPCPCPTEICPRTGNVVVNGDFEDIGPDPNNPVLVGWSATNARPRVRNGQPASTFFSGNVVAILGSPSTSGDASISQTVPVTGGCPYQLTFAGSGSPSGPIVAVTVGFRNDGIISTFTRRITTLGSGYHTFVYVLDVPQSATSATITFSKTGAGETFIDLVTFSAQ